MGQYPYQPQPRPYRPIPQPYIAPASGSPPKQTIPPQVIVLGVAVILIMFITLGMVYLLWPEPVVPLDLKVESSSSAIDQGDSLQLSQFLPAGDNPTVVSYEISHLTTRDIIVQKSESIPAQNSIPSSYVLDIPQAAPPGQYIVTVSVRRASQQTKEQFPIRIRRKVIEPITPVPDDSETVPQISERPELQCPDGCNDYNQCTLDRCVDGACNYEPFTPCCGNNACETGENQDSCPQDCAQRGFQKSEVVTEITNRAIENADDQGEAVTICKTLSKSYDADQCMKEVAAVSKDYEVCLNVVNIDDKDTCLLDQAIDNEQFIACEFVQNRWLQDSCYHYKRLKELE